MTKQFAIKEAARRTEALGTTHYVLESEAVRGEYFGATVAYRGSNVAATFEAATFGATATEPAIVPSQSLPVKPAQPTRVQQAAGRLGNL